MHQNLYIVDDARDRAKIVPREFAANEKIIKNKKQKTE